DEHLFEGGVPAALGRLAGLPRRHRWLRDPRVSSRAGGPGLDFPGRRARLAARLNELEIDAFLVTRLPNVRYLTGFTGSNGQLVRGARGGVSLPDGRYPERSRHEVPDLDRETYPAFPSAFADAVAKLGAARIGFESAGVTHKLFTELADAGPGGAEMVPTD